MSGNWGIKADDGYVNFIHGTIDKVWDFETSSNNDDVCIFGEMVAKGYAQALNATAFRINISEQPQLTIPKSIAESVEKHHKDFQGRGYFEEIVLVWIWETKPDNESLDFTRNDFILFKPTSQAKPSELI